MAIGFICFLGLVDVCGTDDLKLDLKGSVEGVKDEDGMESRAAVGLMKTGTCCRTGFELATVDKDAGR